MTDSEMDVKVERFREYVLFGGRLFLEAWLTREGLTRDEKERFRAKLKAAE